MASTYDNHPAVCLCPGCAPKRQRFMAQHRAEQERLRAAQHRDEAARRAAAWRRDRAEARARRRARIQRKRRSIRVVSMALCVARYGPITVVMGLQLGFLTVAIMALRMDAWMERRLVQEWLMHRIWTREWLRDSDTALLRLYRRLQQVGPAVTPSPVAKGPVRARCGGPLLATAHLYDWCGACAGELTSPATPAATAKSPDPTGPQVFSPPLSADPSPSADPSAHGTTTGLLAVGTVLNGRYSIANATHSGPHHRG